MRPKWCKHSRNQNSFVRVDYVRTDKNALGNFQWVNGWPVDYQKTAEKLKNRLFHKNRFVANF